MITRLLSSFLLFLPFSQPQELEQKKEATAPPYVERSQKQFSFYPGGKLEVAADVPGDIKVIGWKRGSVQVEIERIIRALPEEQARVLATQFPVKMRYTQTLGSIHTLGPTPGTVDMDINLTLYVPKDKTDMHIRMLKGNLAIGSVNGWVEATLQEGSIETKSVSGYYSVYTKMGDVHVELSDKRWDGYGFTGITQKGNIELRVPVSYSAALQLDTKAGEITVDYPEQLVEGESVPLEATAKKTARSLTATVGDGGAPIRLMTMTGIVELKKLEAPKPATP
jgi:DUF4097 and DUF4098 domain-containing protein YvlB